MNCIKSIYGSEFEKLLKIVQEGIYENSFWKHFRKLNCWFSKGLLNRLNGKNKNKNKIQCNLGIRLLFVNLITYANNVMIKILKFP